MNAKSLLESLTYSRRYGGQVERVVELPARPAQFGELSEPLKLPMQAALANAGIANLYTHQISAIERVRAGRSVVIVTGTASGKTLCYNIPVIEAILEDPLATALFVYPTKALAQDQLRGLDRFNDGAGGTPALREEGGRDAGAMRCGINFIAGTYDGDTPAPQRRKLRDNGQVILTNPDMLHQAILPNHSRWSKYFSNLKYVVLDEVHAYRGVFGSHLSNVMRRLQRICEHYGASPQFICCSATIANPVEHASRIVGHEMALVDDDGSPRGPKRFVLWNPPMIGGPDSTQPSPAGERRGPLGEAIDLMTALVRENVQTIAFVRTRLAAELISRGARDNLGLVSPRFVEKIQAYRGGYLPEERREIERRLASGEILGVASTNALELGIDIGSLDACLMVGYPGTIASAWQQAGRAGRGAEEALIFLIGDNAPIDQYLMNHSDYLFDQNPENAVVDPDNPHVAIGHIKSAAYELPIPDAEVDRFGDYAEPMLEILEEQKLVKHLRGKWYWANEEYPAATVNLRNIGGPVYNIIAATENNRVIGTMDEVSAFSQLHKHAVYLHDAQCYLVTDLDTENAIAYVEKRDLDYYTQAITSSRLQIEEKEEETKWRDCTVGLGPVTVTTTIPMFKKVKYHSRDSLGFEQLELPPQILETVSLWLVPPQASLEEVRHHKLVMAEGLIGIANCLVEVAPMFVMCDVQDVGVVVDASNLGQGALFLYDRYPGGMGFSERCADQMEDLIQAVHEVISKCPCTDGCPSCVGAALPAFALSDIDSGTRGRIPDKQAALVITHQLLGLEPYVPKRREGVVAAVPEPEAEKAAEETEAVGPKLPLELRKRLSDLRRKE